VIHPKLKTKILDPAANLALFSSFPSQPNHFGAIR